MLSKRSTLILLFSGFLIVSGSCGKDGYDSPGYFVEYAIDNISLHNVVLVHRVAGSTVTDTNFIGRRSRLSFHYVSGDDLSTRQYLDGLTSLPFDLIEVRADDGHGLLFDESDVENWERVMVYGTARVQLNIRVDDFNE